MLQTNQRKAYFLAISAVIAWSTVATVFKIALSKLNLMEIIFIASLTASLFLFLFILITKKQNLIFKQNLKDLLNSCLLGFLNPFLYYLILFKAYDLLPAQEALTLNYSWVIVTVILSIIILKQVISVIEITGLLISFIGVILIVSKGKIFSMTFESPLGVVLALLSSIIWGFYWILNLKDKRDDIVKLLMNFIFGFLYITILNCVMKSSFNYDIISVLPSIYIGIFEMGITFVLWLSALRYSENTAKVGNLIFLSPFISLLFISIFLDENIQFFTIIGLVFIIIGSLCQKKTLNYKQLK